MTAYQDMGPRAFIASVLWIRGHKTGDVANVVKWTSGQMRGFVNRQFKTAREHMTYQERAAELAAMKAVRRDDGRLRDEHFKPIELQGKPAPKLKPLAALKKVWAERLAVAEQIENPERRQAEIAACNSEFRAKLQQMHRDKVEGGLDLTTKGGRKDARALEGEVIKMVRETKRAAEAREAGLNPRRGKVGERSSGIIRSSALNYLATARLLRDSVSGDKEQTPEEKRRLIAGERLYHYAIGTSIGSVGALDYERASMGGGGGVPMTPTEHRLRCVYAIDEIRQLMSRDDYLLLDAVVNQDVFIWERSPAGSKARAAYFIAIRHLLDVVAVYEKLMSDLEYVARWDETLPTIVKHDNPRDHAAAIAEFMAGAR